jgi:hypothetical protein
MLPDRNRNIRPLPPSAKDAPGAPRHYIRISDRHMVALNGKIRR